MVIRTSSRNCVRGFDSCFRIICSNCGICGGRQLTLLYRRSTLTKASASRATILSRTSLMERRLRALSSTASLGKALRIDLLPRESREVQGRP